MFRKIRLTLFNKVLLRNWKSGSLTGRKLMGFFRRASYPAFAESQSSFLCSTASITSRMYCYLGTSNGKLSKFLDSEKKQETNSSATMSNRKNTLQVASAIRRDFLQIDEVVSVLLDSFCEDLCVIKVDQVKTKFHYVDYFVIASGRSVRHLKSMAFLLCSKVILNGFY